jgi:hypothetical protein
MDIAIRQIEQLRSQLEETQDYIVTVQEESDADRKYYRNRLNSFLSKLSTISKARDLSLLALKKFQTVTIESGYHDHELEEVNSCEYRIPLVSIS